MHGLFYIFFRFFVIAFGVMAIAYGFKGLMRVRADAYDPRSYKTNLWGAVGAIILGLLLILFGMGYIRLTNLWIY